MEKHKVPFEVKREKCWVPPKTEEISVGELARAIRLALDCDLTDNLKEILKGIDKPEWYSSNLTFRAPGGLITPVKIGDNWTHLWMPNYVEVEE